MWPEKLLSRYFMAPVFDTVLEHSRNVAALADEIAGYLNVSDEVRSFIVEASYLHDIGVCQVAAPDLGVFGAHPYIMHGVLGRAILEKEGYPLHALVCERHTGVGLTCDDIVRQSLPLPHRDMCPLSLPEEIICFSDLFYSKKAGRLSERKSTAHVRRKLLQFGEEKAAVFDVWLERFNINNFLR